MIKNKLVELRTKQGKTQLDVVVSLRNMGHNVSYSKYVRWEKGTNLHTNDLVPLADVFGVDPMYFLKD